MKTKKTAGREISWDEAEKLWVGLRLADEVTPDEADELRQAFLSGKAKGHADGYKRGWAAALATLNPTAG
jgi:hypothetical protein